MGRPTYPALLTMCLMVSACGGEGGSSEQATQMASAPESSAAGKGAAPDKAAPDKAAADNSAEVPVTIPQIAYSYRHGFRLSAGDIPKVQQAHADLCEKKGRAVCRILNMSQSGSEGDYAHGMLELEIAAPQARAFGADLAKVVDRQGGEQIASSIEGEDLSRQIVDTQAHLRSRILLRDRLMEILATRKGSVEELVAAERGVAEVNSEIDKAQSWLAEMKGRVSFSRMTIDYQSGGRNAGSFWQPIADALSNIGMIMGTAIAVLITFLVGFLPFAVLGGAGYWIYRRLRKPGPAAQARAHRESARIMRDPDDSA